MGRENRHAGVHGNPTTDDDDDKATNRTRIRGMTRSSLKGSSSPLMRILGNI
jgi:hypothetical protein